MFLLKILKIKFEIFKPKKSDILLYDTNMVSEFSNFINKKFTILQVRPLKINLFILLNVFIKRGFNNIKINYFAGYINFVNPKIVVTFNDVDPNFYKLNKYLSSKIKMIAIQHSTKIKENFKHFSNSKIEFKNNYNVLFSKNYSKIYSKYIRSNNYICGSFRNNFFKKNKLKKRKKILFISSIKEKKNILFKKMHSIEKKIIQNLNKYSKKRGIEYTILTKGFSRQNYKEILNLDLNCDFIDTNIIMDKYRFLDKFELSIFIDSTLGLETLSRGNKALSIPHKRNHNFIKGFFVKKNPDFLDFEKKVDELFHMKKKFWNNKIRKEPNFIIYDYRNVKLKKLFNRFLKH